MSTLDAVLSRIDQDIDLGDVYYAHHVQAAHDFLARVPPGTFVLTYHGYGGRMPAGFEAVCAEREFSGDLRLWQMRKKRR